MSNVDDFMQGSGGYPLIKLTREGSKLIGDLLEARLVDERDYDTGQVVRWDNGDARKQLVIDVRVDWAASVDITTGKDGAREEIGSYYCRYTAFLAMKAATEATGCKMSEVGRLALARTKDGTPRNPRHAPPQQFAAQVERRAAGSGVDDLLGDSSPAGQGQPEQQPAATAATDLL